MKRLIGFSLLFIAACKPPAADEYVARTQITTREAPSEPLDSPDTEGAVWAESRGALRLIYGKPGERPLLALECTGSEAAPTIAYTRFVHADPHAKAILALIGNSHVARLKIDATRSNEAWLWQGEIAADSPDLEALTGPRQVEATVPGAGSVILNPSSAPGALIARCRSRADGLTPALPEEQE